MLKIVLGIFVGFVVWSILWIGTDELLARIFADWYGADRAAYFEALSKGAPFTLSSTILLISLIRGTIFTILAGFISVSISKEHSRTALFLGVLLLAVGVYAHSYSIFNFPVWYHLLFLGMLVPMTLVGGKLAKKQGQNDQ
ncbi:MAG: hypothetical protein HKN25_12175 [Pyrinomonadaceae bacterium]|nr:hypothetical protein [Pyrinomonadaceae bacterium]